MAGYVRTLKVFGNWLQAEELAEASALRALRKPRVPDKLIEPVPDDTLRRLLGLASVRDLGAGRHAPSPGGASPRSARNRILLSTCWAEPASWPLYGKTEISFGPA